MVAIFSILTGFLLFTSIYVLNFHLYRSLVKKASAGRKEAFSIWPIGLALLKQGGTLLVLWYGFDRLGLSGLFLAGGCLISLLVCLGSSICFRRRLLLSLKE